MTPKQLKEDNDSLKHINGYLAEQNRLVPEMLQVLQDFIKIGNQRWRSCRPDSFEKETLNKAKALISKI